MDDLGNEITVSNETPAKALRCYVLVVGKKFPKGHIHQGKGTDFPRLVLSDVKCSSIRHGYESWKSKVDAVNAGTAYISIRQWEHRPYNSKQIELKQISKAQCQKMHVDVSGNVYLDGRERNDFPTIASTDGLSGSQLMSWIFPGPQSSVGKTFDGCRITWGGAIETNKKTDE